jgi:hypothetical protein
MRQRHAVEQPAPLPPIGQVPIHQAYKSLVVVAFQEVRQFMHDNVLKALPRFASQVRIESKECWATLQPPHFVRMAASPSTS